MTWSKQVHGHPDAVKAAVEADQNIPGVVKDAICSLLDEFSTPVLLDTNGHIRRDDPYSNATVILRSVARAELPPVAD